MMIVNGWTIALSVCSSAVLFCAGLAARTGIRVVGSWDFGSDSASQIKLESETWLSSALMGYGVLFQMLSLVLLILAADNLSTQLVGAMCATGAFTANGYGIPSLLLKIVLLFCCGYWLLLHNLDQRSETYCLVRLKNWYLLLLFPLLVADAIVQSLYLFNLTPDVITSCCGIIFQQGKGDGYNLLDPLPSGYLLILLYTLAALTIFLGLKLPTTAHQTTGSFLPTNVVMVYSLTWLLFLIIALLTITVFFSSYIYAMPSHRCPFDILKGEYNYIGFPIYLSLFTGAFFGTGCIVAQLACKGCDVEKHGMVFQRVAAKAGSILLLLFLALTAYAPLRYYLLGGEV